MIHQVLDPRITLQQILQPRLHLDGFGERIVETLLGSRDELGYRVGLSEREAERPADIFDSCLGLERSKSRNLRDPIGPVLVLNVLDHLGSATNTKVNVDIRHRASLGIEKALEQ